MSGSREGNPMRPVSSRFRHYHPGPPLSPFVRNYWSLAAGGEPGASRRQRILPDGCIDILFVRRDPTEVFRAFVVGAMTRPIFEEMTAHTEYLGIRFAPGGLAHFLKLRVDELTDRIVPLEDLPALLPSAERIADTPDVPTRLGIIEGQLTRRLLPQGRNAALAGVLDLISACPATVTVPQLARRAGWSPRHLRRVFHEAVGVGPKTFCEIVRFRNALRTLRGQRRPDLLHVALEAGYYDQAHFIHEFHRFYGTSPSAVLKERGF